MDNLELVDAAAVQESIPIFLKDIDLFQEHISVNSTKVHKVEILPK